ncbi:MAG: hypothetical protein WBP64_03585 [Nitrososphaeraceae archaeon]
MQDQDSIRDLLNQVVQAVNSKDDKNRYFDLHDDSVITHGVPNNFPTTKEGMRFITKKFKALRG